MPPLPRPGLTPLNPVQALPTRLCKPFSPSQMQYGQSAATSIVASAGDLIASSNTSVISPNAVEITLASSVLNQSDSSFKPPLLSPPTTPIVIPNLSTELKIILTRSLLQISSMTFSGDAAWVTPVLIPPESLLTLSRLHSILKQSLAHWLKKYLMVTLLVHFMSLQFKIYNSPH